MLWRLGFSVPGVPSSEPLSVALTSTARLQLPLNIEKVHMYCLKGRELLNKLAHGPSKIPSCASLARRLSSF